MIMVLDQDATALTRMWCVFEVWVSRSLRLTFQMFLPTGEFNFFGTDEASRKVRRRLVGLQVASAVCSVEGDTEMILRVIDQSDGGRAAVAWQVKRTMSASAVAFLLLLLGDSSSFLFAMPWILGLTETWTMKTVDHLQLNTYPRWLVRLTASIFVFFPGLFHLRHWRWLANPSDVVTTFSALWVLMLPEQRAEGFPGEIPSTLCQRCRHYARRPLLGFDQAFVAGFLAVALLEMICVLALIVAIPWWKRHDTQGVTDALLCSEQTSTPSCVLLTLYLLLKTLPWIVGFLANAVRQVRGTRQDVDVRMKDFLVASPRVGFLLALLSLTVMSLRQQRSFCCHDDGTTCDLTHLSFAQQGDVMLSMFMVGLSAWGISVAWSCGALVQELTCKTLRRALGVVVVLLFLSLPVGIITMHQFDPDDSWLHLELGCAVWVTASVFFHGKDLWAEFVRTLARIAHQFRSGEGAPPRMATHGSAGLAET